ncbi:hypothetical protein ACFX13_010894 [Malus domestica]
MIDLSGNKFSGFIPDANFNTSINFNNGELGKMQREPFGTSHNADTKVLIVVTGSSELSFNYVLSSMVGIDFSNNVLDGEVPGGLFGLRGLQYLNLSRNFLRGRVPDLEKMWSLRALDVSHNSLSGHIPENISSLQHLTLMDLSYNCFSGLVTKKQGYSRFPGAFVGNPDLCLESSDGGCDPASLPAVPGKAFEGEEVEGRISVWVFCLSAFLSFYFTGLALFCSPRARNHILKTSA